MKLPEKVTIQVIVGDITVYHTYYNQQEAKNFIHNDTICLPEKNRIAISNEIFTKEGKCFEECSKAIFFFCYGEEEKKYYCEDLSKENLVWERGL